MAYMRRSLGHGARCRLVSGRVSSPVIIMETSRMCCTNSRTVRLCGVGRKSMRSAGMFLSSSRTPSRAKRQASSASSSNEGGPASFLGTLSATSDLHAALTRQAARRVLARQAFGFLAGHPLGPRDAGPGAHVIDLAIALLTDAIGDDVHLPAL